MSKSKGRKRKNEEDLYDLQTILDDDESNDGESAIPAAAGKNAENDTVKILRIKKYGEIKYFKSSRRKRMNMVQRIIGLTSN